MVCTFAILLNLPLEVPIWHLKLVLNRISNPLGIKLCYDKIGHVFL